MATPQRVQKSKARISQLSAPPHSGLRSLGLFGLNRLRSFVICLDLLIHRFGGILDVGNLIGRNNRDRVDEKS